MPDLFREILAHNLGSQDRDVAFGARCQGVCDTARPRSKIWRPRGEEGNAHTNPVMMKIVIRRPNKAGESAVFE